MKPAYLKNTILGFAKPDEKIWYRLIKESALLEELGTDWFFELKNQIGSIVTVKANTDIFKLYLV